MGLLVFGCGHNTTDPEKNQELIEQMKILNKVKSDWEALIEWLETSEDSTIAQQAFAHLKAAGGDRAKAGWRRWSDVEGELA